MKTNEEWKAWGKDDPLYGVASWAGRRCGKDNEWADVEFYDLGRSDWRDFSARWDCYGYNRDSCLEIGCGAGRITKQLCEKFQEVHALDVSIDMINYAQRNVTGNNVTWHVTDGTSIPLQDSLVLSVFSSHVFQHFPSEEDGLSYFEEIYRILKPGGTMMIHLPLHDFPSVNRKFSKLARYLYSFFLVLTSVKADIRRWQMRRGGRKYMHGISYEAPQLYEKLKGIGFDKIEFVNFPMQSNDDLHSCVFATKT
ncbi:MAG: class I SAM-dependent methyltransferase [Desulfobacterales bacterium]|nr:class I SAM-dependent methyltransferase [Desulfobacterales bacterium]